MNPASAAVPASVDLPALAAGLGQRLRTAGLTVTPERSARFASAVALSPPAGRTQLYWLARTVFVSSQAELPAFDRVFRAVFEARLGPDEDRGDPHSPPLDASRPSERPPSARARALPGEPGATGARSISTGTGAGDADGREVEVPLALASDEERLAERSFAALDAAELAQLRRLMERVDLATPRRRTRRDRRSAHGRRLDLRRTMRSSLRTGGDPIRLARRRRRERPRRLVLLCDISGSMEPYARAYLQLLTSAVASGTPAEAFVFATRLTRLTRELAGRNPEAAIQRAAKAAPDWSSGTRIGQALKTFNDRHGRRGMARGAVVVILSDGWERTDPALVGREMERLARLAHRIVWVNPRAAAPGFEPRAGGMAAALPFCDALVSGHDLSALDEVARALSATGGSARTPSAEPDAGADADETSWPSAEPTEAQKPVPMPSGYGPKRGHTTP